MRLHSIHLHNIGPFADARLDLDALPGPVVAVIGDNGSGKSTLLSLGFRGALYRDGGGSGTIAERATARDSFVHACVDDLDIKHVVDAHTDGGEVLVRKAGAVAIESGGVRAFDRWAKANLPAVELFDASVFGAQRSKGFAGLGAADRKAVLLRAIGGAGLEPRAKLAGEKEREALALAKDIAARLGALGMVEETFAGVRRMLDRDRGALCAADLDLEAARLGLDEARRQAAAAEQAGRDFIAWRAAEDHARAAWAAADRNRGEIRARRAALVATVATDADRETAGRLPALRERLTVAEAEERAAREEHTLLAARGPSDELAAAETAERAARDEELAARAQATAAEGERSAADAASSAAQRAANAAERERDKALRTAASLADVEDARARLPALWEARRVADEELVAAQAEVERLGALIVGGKDRRIEGLRGGLRAVALVADAGCVDVAQRTLATDDAVAVEQAAAPAAHAAAVEARKTALDRCAEAEQAHREAEALAARLPDLVAAREDAARSHVEMETHAAEAVAHGFARTAAQIKMAAANERASKAMLRALDAAKLAVELRRQATAEVAAAAVEVEQRGAVVTGLRREIATAEMAQQRVADSAAATATLAALDSQLAEAERTAEELRLALASRPAAPVVPPEPDVALRERGVTCNDAEVRRLTAVVARSEQALAAAEERAAAAAKLRVELQAAEQLAADWALVARGYGKDGVQALLIDAAAPEFTAIVNDLLRSCFGSRYTVTIATTRAKKSSDGDREVCDVLVYDAESREREKERDVRRFSDGQFAILNEGLELSLSLLSSRRAGMADVTLVRDETAGKLSAANARAYVAMLRRAAEVVGAAHILFVSHNEDLWKLADARVYVRDGKVEVEGAEEVCS